MQHMFLDSRDFNLLLNNNNEPSRCLLFMIITTAVKFTAATAVEFLKSIEK